MLQTASRTCLRFIACLAVAFTATTGQAAPDGTAASCALPDTVAAQVGDWQLDRSLFRTLYKQQLLSDENLTPDAFINDVIVDTLLSRHALASYGESAWGEETRVGFPLAVKLEDQRVSLASQLAGKRLQAWVESRFAQSANQQTHLRITDSGALQAQLASELVFQDLLPEKQLKQLAEVPAAELVWSQAESTILSLAEVWRRTNVQERLGLQQGDLSMLRQIAERWAQGQIVDAWLAQDATVSVNEKRFFAEFPALRWVATATRKRLGVLDVMHESNPALTARAAQVTPEESLRYYQALKRDSKNAHAMEHQSAEFSRITKVYVEQLILPDEASAQAAHDAIAAGMSFDAALTRFKGQGPIRQTLQRQEQMGWLHATAFALEEGRLSRPIRMPGAAHNSNADAPRNWIVMRVISKYSEWMPADSPSIHYQASLTIARDALQSDYSNLLKQLRAKAEVCIQPDWSATP